MVTLEPNWNLTISLEYKEKKNKDFAEIKKNEYYDEKYILFSSKKKKIEYEIYQTKNEFLTMNIYKIDSITMKEKREMIVMAENVISYILYMLEGKTCMKKLIIHWYTYKNEKTLPKKDNMINKINVNSGYTWPCQEITNIVIYRKEESQKVMIHECVHAFGLDIVFMERMNIQNNENMNQLDVIENIKIEWRESVTEMIARLWYIQFLSKIHKKDQNDLIESEIGWSMRQAILYFHHNDIRIGEIRETDKRVRENTHVFSYYIIPCIWLYELHNKYDLYDEYKSVIEKWMRGEGDWYGLLEKMEEMLEGQIKDNSFRMTIS